MESEYSKLLVEPTSVSSVDGVLHTSIHLEVATQRIEGRDFTSRTLNGTIPGPTLRLKPGDTLIVDFYNNLSTDQKPYAHNQFSAPNESNLHFHGLHVSGELPSDDTTYTVGPGQSYRYITKLPDDHLPGTHWVHPHRHGSTALQVGGGAAASIIVEDTDTLKETLPPQVTNAREMLLVAQEFDYDDLSKIANDVGDSVVALSEILEGAASQYLDVQDQKVYLVNGQANPLIPVQPNEWIRLRIVHVGWTTGRLDLALEGCEMQLIAKDGVYLPILPRLITEAQMVNAGRADIMIRCPFEDGTTTRSLTCKSNICRGQALVTIIKSTNDNTALVDTSPIEPTEMIFPAYLQDLRNTAPTPGCSCTTEVHELNYPTNQSDYFHETFQGAIVERHLDSNNHPYHQHVHPFQIVGGIGNSHPYYQVGDWHDTIQGEPIVRYSPTVFSGKMMIHCHRLNHEDMGMMNIEYIHPNATAGTINPSTGNSCVCIPPENVLWPIILFAVGIFLVLVATPVTIWYLRRRGRCLCIPCPCAFGANLNSTTPSNTEAAKSATEEHPEGGQASEVQPPLVEPIDKGQESQDAANPEIDEAIAKSLTDQESGTASKP